ncbi:MAG: DNA polymerase III subunit alpha [Pyrinomonadaceae bacterium]
MVSLQFKEKDFVHLHLHSDYSLLQSAIQLKPLAAKLTEMEMQACAITDYANMYGAISFYNTMKGSGIRPIIGYEAFVATGSRFEKSSATTGGERPFYNLILLAKDYSGYQNLVRLASKAFTEGLYHKPRIDKELLARYCGGIIALSGGSDGAVMQKLIRGDRAAAEAYAGEMAEIFGPDNFYLEIQDHDIDEQRRANKELIEISKKLSIPLVATNEAHYLTREDARAHEVLLCIGEGRTLTDGRYTLETPTFYVRSAAEMWEIFGNELPEALTNTLKIATLCDLDLSPHCENKLPVFPIPDDFGSDSIDDYFEAVVFRGFEKRLSSVLRPMAEAGTLKYPLEVYEQRLRQEIDIIKQMGFAGYFLIVWDFIRYAVEQKIPVGVGRGSAAGSLVAYCLEITGIDPIQYDLLFERFLNPERISMPDIDIDFCIRGREAVIEHVVQVYGRESVCQIITFGTMASKAAIKDVGRALNMPYGEVERIAKLIPPPFRGRNTSISQALERVPELRAAVESDPKVKDLIDLALRLEGCSRHSSVHAAGVVISPKPLEEIVPVAVSAKSELTSQYSMTDLEKVGMLKMDFLALTTLTIIDDCLKTLRQRAGIEIDWSKIPLDDAKTMQIFAEGRTDAIFQFESSGMQEICRKLKPENLEDLAALNALYRPGPLDGGMIDDFIARRRGEKKVRYLVPQMEEILKNTYGVLVYQEQIMQIAQKLGGYRLGEADLMRRAMGKKKREEMAMHREKFVSGAAAGGISREKAEEIFNLMAQFADYGFNRSHSVAYAYLAFQTAYLKAHYPTYFLAAVLSHESDDSAKIYKYSNELRSLGLNLLPPDINLSDEGFTPTDDSVRFGLSAIKGIGTTTVRAIIEARKSGHFKSLFDLVGRLNQGVINKRALEGLIAAGSLDSLMPAGKNPGEWRAELFAAIDEAVRYGQKKWSDRESGQNALFGGFAEDSADHPMPATAVKPWTQAELSQREKEALGFYLSVHPLDPYLETVKKLGIKSFNEIGDLTSGAKFRMAGVVSAMQVRYSKKGNRFATFRLEDTGGGVKCLVWSDAYTKLASLLADDRLLIIEGRIEAVDGQDVTVIVESAENLADASLKAARKVIVTLPAADCGEDFLNDVYSIICDSPGQCDVIFRVPLDNFEVLLQSQIFRIEGSTRIESALAERGCRVEWQ